MEPKFEVGKIVDSPVGQGKIIRIDRVAGEWWYWLQLHDGWYVDPDDQNRHYSSKLIKRSDAIVEDDLSLV